MALRSFTSGSLPFSTSAWPAARVVTSRDVETYALGLDIDPDRLPAFIKALKWLRSHRLRAHGKGKPWSTTEPLGFWRDAAVLDLDNAEAIIAFVKRRGDPLGHVDGKDGETETGLWFGLCGHLRHMAEGWEVEDANGVSRLTDDPGRLNHVTQWWRHFALPHYADQISLTVDPHGSTLPAMMPKTLGAYMILSAGSAFARKAPMRRCDHCHSWFELKRSDARFCTASCRAMSSAK
jgi:hypothetical protein